MPASWNTGSPVGQVQDTGDRPPSDNFIVQCIHIMHEGDKLSQWTGDVMGHDFFKMSIDSISPVKLVVWQSREVWLFGAELDDSMLHLNKVRDDALHMLHVSFSWGNIEIRHGHDSSGEVNPAKGN